ncbi:putative tRNA adenosine deaminase-associated protein [Actinopolyspora lacussalsi]|uniref:Putative tRNA adenosine deaminase-associated protein n=2 Tax=Actinopolyspora alba group TaxID=2893675 RepID=A0A1I1W191_9ACTN|nr:MULTISPECIES: tRNA adenosine deaminase-associated protein [Actinopolyspora alba group]MDP9643489.1 putative tRNA adenosine deaminase-associated protein [Actinopolyspora lacussalsi]SFD86690.1 putative tRNA adenosine deaminase-associated protein [Actinopolyspora alba]SFT90077.1 putative tRNA adenosine deaminase-associated protein [Actinopolyspora righensis]
MTLQEPVAGFAVAAVREDGRWRCDMLDGSVLTGLDAIITALRELRSSGAAIGMCNVDDEFFVLVRPVPGGVELALSDAAAALDYDVAADVLDLLRTEPPDEEDEEIWPEGNLALLSDLGLPEEELLLITEEVDLYPDEQLEMIAQRCGFGEQFTAVLERL